VERFFPTPLAKECVINRSSNSNRVHPVLSPEKELLLKQRLNVKEKGQTVEGPSLSRREQRDCVPLSFSQLQMWVIDRMTPGNPAYNLPVGYRLHGCLDASALERSFNEVICRHEILRTTFAVENDEPVQRIHSECKIQINIVKLDSSTAESRVQVLATEQGLKSFDLSRLPLIQVSLFRLGETEHILIVNIHHIVVDGISMGRILAEVSEFYREFTSGQSAHPSDVNLQYADFALWQRQVVDSGAFDDQLLFWRKQLAGELPVLELPSDFARPPLQSFRGSNVFLQLPPVLVGELTSLGARNGVRSL
jgi:hypothetical protein